MTRSDLLAGMEKYDKLIQEFRWCYGDLKGMYKVQYTRAYSDYKRAFDALEKGHYMAGKLAVKARLADERVARFIKENPLP